MKLSYLLLLLNLRRIATSLLTSVKIQNLTNILGNLEFKENTIKETVDNNYNRNYLNEGIKGLAQFTRDHIINSGEDGKKKYLCSDQALTKH